MSTCRNISQSPYPSPLPIFLSSPISHHYTIPLFHTMIIPFTVSLIISPYLILSLYIHCFHHLPLLLSHLSSPSFLPPLYPLTSLFSLSFTLPPSTPPSLLPCLPASLSLYLPLSLSPSLLP